MKSQLITLSILLVVLSLFTTQCSSNQAGAVPTSTSQPPKATLSEPAVKTQPPSSSQIDAKALVAERCTGCHNISRTQNAKKTPEEWQSTVERMIKNGAVLNAEEKAAVIEYLAATYKK